MNPLRVLRTQLGLSRREMAETLDVSLSLYEKIELGKRNMSAKFLKKLKLKYPDLDINIFLL